MALVSLQPAICIAVLAGSNLHPAGFPHTGGRGIKASNGVPC